MSIENGSVRRSGRAARLAILLSVGAAFAAAPAAQAAPATFGYSGSPIAIPDGADFSGTQPGATVSAPISVAGLGTAIADVDFRIDGSSCSATAGSATVGIDHTFVNDLEITLTSPDGTSVIVIGNTDGSGNNLCQTILDDDADVPSIQTAVTDQAPFSGTWLPNSPLSAFDGEDPNGTWNVSAQDLYAQDTGSIRAVSIVIDARFATTTAGTASADVALGGAVTDAALVGGRTSQSAGDTVDFRLYGPDDASCTQSAAFESLGRSVDADGRSTSEPFTPAARGTYRWTASYGGDADNLASSAGCGASGQSVLVKAATTIAGASSQDVDLGGALSSGATVSGRDSAAAGDTVDFRLFGPGDATCAGTPVFESLGRPLDAGGAATSASFAPQAPGSYSWTAFYVGEANSGASSIACGTAGQSAVVRAPAQAAAAPAPVVTAPQRCASRRRVTVRLIARDGLMRDLRGARIVGAKLVGAKGKVVSQRHTRSVATIDLRGLPKGSFAVAVRIRLRGGRTVTFRRSYRTCEYVPSALRITGAL